jgi:hypothetical protein
MPLTPSNTPIRAVIPAQAGIHVLHQNHPLGQEFVQGGGHALYVEHGDGLVGSAEVADAQWVDLEHGV